MEVGAAETVGRDTCPTRGTVGCAPFFALVGETEGGGGEMDVGVGGAGVEGGGDGFVVKG